MVSQKKIMKFLVLIIVAVFLLSSGLMSLMYFVDMNDSWAGEAMTGDILTGDIAIEESFVDQNSDEIVE
jgi:hypothetical protein